MVPRGTVCVDFLRTLLSNPDLRLLPPVRTRVPRTGSLRGRGRHPVLTYLLRSVFELLIFLLGFFDLFSAFNTALSPRVWIQILAILTRQISKKLKLICPPKYWCFDFWTDRSRSRLAHIINWSTAFELL